MMNRSFRILGVKDDATREEVKAAYELKVSRYKGPDYAEDPEYVEIKLRELKTAFDEAYTRAGGGSRPEVRPVSQRTETLGDREASDRAENELGIDFSEIAGKLQDIVRGKISLPKRSRPEAHTPQVKKIIISAVTMIAVVLVTAIGGCMYEIFDGGTGSGYDYPQSIYDYDYDEVSDKDWELSDFAWDSRMYLSDGEILDDCPVLERETGDGEKSYKAEADQFAQNYWQYESVEDVTQYLCDNYPDFSSDPYSPIEEQLDAIFYFYEFQDIEDAIWYPNPYTNEPMDSYGDYLEYLNQYWEDPRE